jgi:hypothetical protein
MTDVELEVTLIFHPRLRVLSGRASFVNRPYYWGYRSKPDLLSYTAIEQSDPNLCNGHALLPVTYAIAWLFAVAARSR